MALTGPCGCSFGVLTSQNVHEVRRGLAVAALSQETLRLLTRRLALRERQDNVDHADAIGPGSCQFLTGTTFTIIGQEESKAIFPERAAECHLV